MLSFPGAPPTRDLPPVPRLSARVVTYLCGLFFLSRLLVLGVAALSHQVVQGPFPPPGRTWVERFVVWDSNWYLSIVLDGYNYHSQGQSSVGFYPLYPLLIRAAGHLGLDIRLAGYAIAHAALFAACVLLWKLAALETRSERVADRAVLFLLFCPGAMWFGMIYTESLFLLTLMGCLLCARRGHWVAAGFWGLTSALTRTPGLFLGGFLFLEGAQQWWEHRRLVRRTSAAMETPPREGDALAAGEDRPPEATPRRWGFARLPWPVRWGIGVAGPVVGHASYLAFLQVRFGDWRAQQRTMAAGWNGGDGLTPPWTALVNQWHSIDAFLVDLSMPLLAITVGLALIGLFTLKRVGYTVLIVTLCVLYVSATPGDAITRYLSTAAPVYIVLAQLADRSRLLETATLVFSVAMMTLLTILLINGYHVI